jgi:hypothetical protein
MKKLTLIVIGTSLCIFMSAAIVSAGGNRWSGFHGTYAMTATGSCLNSPTVVEPGVPPSNSFAAIIVEEGTWTFERKGTGTFIGNRFGMTLPPLSGHSATPTEIVFDFSYKLTQDGEIDITVDTSTFNATFLAGVPPDKTKTFSVDIYTMFGRLSSDHKTMTLTSGGFEVQKTTVKLDGTTVAELNGICNIGRVLIRVDD